MGFGGEGQGPLARGLIRCQGDPQAAGRFAGDAGAEHSHTNGVIEMADKKPGRGGQSLAKGKKEPKFQEPVAVTRRSNKRDKASERHRLCEGEVVMPVQFDGSKAGDGHYTAGMVNGVLVLDESGKPMRFRDFPLGPKPVT